MKLLVHELWATGIGSNDKVSDEICKKWIDIQQQLKSLENIKNLVTHRKKRTVPSFIVAQR